MKASPEVLAIVGLRAAALALGFAGQTSASRVVSSAADAVEGGFAVDDHMKLVAEKLKVGPSTDADWDDVDARIKASSQATRDA